MNREVVTAVLRDNLERVRARIAAAADRAGRDPAEVTLIAVTKSVPPSVIAVLRDLGMRHFGENRAPQLSARAADLGSDLRGLAPPVDDGAAAPTWHMIGHVQRNKVKPLLRACRVVHSLDSARLADELEHHAAALSARVDVFLEVNVSGEAQKDGVAPEELAALHAHVASLAHLRICGLMAMAPLVAAGDAARPYFLRLKELSGMLPAAMRGLSMGMSQDFEAAVECGATHVRIGSTLFEGLPANG